MVIVLVLIGEVAAFAAGFICNQQLVKHHERVARRRAMDAMEGG